MFDKLIRALNQGSRSRLSGYANIPEVENVGMFSLFVVSDKRTRHLDFPVGFWCRQCSYVSLVYENSESSSNAMNQILKPHFLKSHEFAWIRKLSKNQGRHDNRNCPKNLTVKTASKSVQSFQSLCILKKGPTQLDIDLV